MTVSVGTKARSAALVCAAALVCLLASPRIAAALQMSDVAGTVDGEAVTVADADHAAGGVAVQAWSAMEGIARNAARAMCTERVYEMLARSEGLDLATWRARQWEIAKPVSEQPSGPKTGIDTVAAAMPSAANHEAHVHAYRARLAGAADRILARELAYARFSAADSGGEPQLPPLVAACLGQTMTREEVQSYAAYPLYELRAQLVAKLCEQFEIGYDKPLVIEHVAAAEGKTLPELLAKVEGTLDDIPEEDVRRVASERFGRIDDAALNEARLVLDKQRREDRRRAWIERVKRDTRVQCTLPLPPMPQSTVRVRGIPSGSPSALPVYYFGAFDCQSCGTGWQTLRAIAANHAGKVRIEFLHHFPEADADMFAQALEAECAARQGRFADYGEWRTSPMRLGSAADAVGLDGPALQTCIKDPQTAVSVLEDTTEALRLGFREAVPSWVIGTQLRRGVQAQGVIDRIIDEQIAARDHPAAPPPAPAAAPSAPLAPTQATGETDGGPAPAAAASSVAGTEDPARDTAPGPRLRGR